MEDKSHSRRPWKVVTLIVAAVAAGLVLYLASGFFMSNTGTTAPPVGQQAASGESRIIGNPVDIDLSTGMDALTLNGPEKASVRFTAKMSGEVTAIAINALTSSQTSQVHVGLQRDADGIPEGEWIDESFGVIGTPDKDGFAVAELQTPVELQKSGTYHIVAEAESTSFSMKTYKANGQAQPFNYRDIDVVWPDSNMNVLSYDGMRWSEENKWPIFAVIYSDGSMEGQPYSLLAPWVIYNSTYVGQQIVPSSDYQIETVSFVVSLEGEPLDKLYYEIRNSSNISIAKGVFADAGDLTRWKSWVKTELDLPAHFKKGEPYRIFLYSPGTDLENPYRVYGHEFSFADEIGYGGTTHQLVISYDAGSKWGDWKDADTVFKLKGILQQ